MNDTDKFVVITEDGDVDGRFDTFAEAKESALQWAADEEINHYIYRKVGTCEVISKAHYIEEK